VGERKEYKKRGKREAYPSRLNIQFPRDLDILEDIYRHKALTIHQIHSMHFGASRSPAQLRITKLFNHNFIDQIVLPVAYGQPGSNPIFNIMGSKGADLLREYRDPDLVWHYSDRELSDRFLKHAKLLNDFYATVVRACRDVSYGYADYGVDNPLIKRTEKELKADRERVNIRNVIGKRETLPFNPDTYFQISANGSVYSFFVEADNKTEKGSVIKEKFRAYRAYYESRMYQEKYGRREPFRVLFVTDGVKRLESLKKWAAEDTAGENFWFAYAAHVVRNSVLHLPVWYVSGWMGRHPLFRTD
jgi:hypothetical protein